MEEERLKSLRDKGRGSESRGESGTVEEQWRMGSRIARLMSRDGRLIKDVKSTL